MKLKLKFLIHEKFGSQARFSQLAGSDESEVSRVIHERRILRPAQQLKWAELLGCDPAELFSTPTSHSPKLALEEDR